MGQVSATSTVLVNAAPDAVLTAVADYQTVRPKICPRSTATTRCCRAAKARAPSSSGNCRPPNRGSATCKAEVDVAGHTVIEKDANSTMVTNWTVAPAGTGSTVTVKTSGTVRAESRVSSRRRSPRWV